MHTMRQTCSNPERTLLSLPLSDGFLPLMMQKKVKREPGREAKPGRGRGRGRTAGAAQPTAGDAGKPLSSKEAVQQSVLKSNVPLSKQIKV